MIGASSRGNKIPRDISTINYVHGEGSRFGVSRIFDVMTMTNEGHPHPRLFFICFPYLIDLLRNIKTYAKSTPKNLDINSL